MDWEVFFVVVAVILFWLFVIGAFIWRVKRRIAAQRLFQQQFAAMAQLMSQAQNAHGGVTPEQQQEINRLAAEAQGTLSALGRIHRGRSEVALGEMMGSASAAGFTNIPRF